ncbi:MAG: hypothetical protein GSR84_02055 [Desulfurococcales archaeon]|nr:hypothetical protein [Desulfurococcales archaeon]
MRILLELAEIIWETIASEDARRIYATLSIPLAVISVALGVIGLLAIDIGFMSLGAFMLDLAFYPIALSMVLVAMSGYFSLMGTIVIAIAAALMFKHHPYLAMLILLASPIPPALLTRSLTPSSWIEFWGR